MGLERRYEYVLGSSSKFWEIDPVRQEGDDSWVVRVKYGRIGTAGQTHSKVFGWRSSAQRYRDSKIDEKLRKGYKLIRAPKPAPSSTQVIQSWSWQSPASAPSNPWIAAPAAAPKACKHDTITRTGSKYKCNACGDQVEFDKPQVAMESPEFETRVRRFFAGAA